VNHTLIAICMTFLLTALSITGTISLNVMAKDTAVGSYKCFPQDDGEGVVCCQLFQGDNKHKWYCTYCDNTNPPSNCLPRWESRNGVGEDIAVPPTEGVSDDPEAGDDRNPSIPPTGGVVDETENDDNSGSDNESPDTQTNTIPRKGGGVLDPSNLNENVIVQ
jgi:hypothetical protein